MASRNMRVSGDIKQVLQSGDNPCLTYQVVSGVADLEQWIISGGATPAKLTSGGYFHCASVVPSTKPVVTGSKGGNAALTSLMSALSTLGLVADSTS